MNTIRFQTKQAFMSALEGRRVFWRAFDERQEREHRAAEQAWLEDARAKLRQALEWDYETFKKKGSLYFDTAPRCPVLMEMKLDNILSVLSYTQAKSFQVNSEGSWATAHQLLTWDPNAKQTVC